MEKKSNNEINLEISLEKLSEKRSNLRESVIKVKVWSMLDNLLCSWIPMERYEDIILRDYCKDKLDYKVDKMVHRMGKKFIRKSNLKKRTIPPPPLWREKKEIYYVLYKKRTRSSQSYYTLPCSPKGRNTSPKSLPITTHPYGIRPGTVTRRDHGQHLHYTLTSRHECAENRHSKI